MKNIYVLSFINYYLPGYKGGGPAKSLFNIIDNLNSDINFQIVTRDKDFNSEVPYPNIFLNEWNKLNSSEIYYADQDHLSLFKIYRLLNYTKFDILYLNSFFDLRFSIIPVLITSLLLKDKRLIILAPRGEFSPGALSIKKFKKLIFIKLSKFLNLHRNIIWHASNFQEADYIKNTMNISSKNVKIAPNLLSKSSINSINLPCELMHRKKGPLRLIFLSRITPKKNLHYLIDLLKNISVQLNLSIYGIIDDQNYWNYCQNLLISLPKNISVNYFGDLSPLQVSECFSSHDIFIFPTTGENFGHVILESLIAGTSVIVSDQVPWQDDSSGALKTIPLSNKPAWIDAINRSAALSHKDLSLLRVIAHDYALNYLRNSTSLELNKSLFLDHIIEGRN